MKFWGSKDQKNLPFLLAFLNAFSVFLSRMASALFDFFVRSIAAAIRIFLVSMSLHFFSKLLASMMCSFALARFTLRLCSVRSNSFSTLYLYNKSSTYIIIIPNMLMNPPQTKTNTKKIQKFKNKKINLCWESISIREHMLICKNHQQYFFANQGPMCSISKD